MQLTEIRMRLNYLRGPIPPQWTSMVFMEVFGAQGNTLTGPLPVSAELGASAVSVRGWRAAAGLGPLCRAAVWVWCC